MTAVTSTVDATRASLSDERRALSAARSRAAFAALNAPSFGQEWRRRAEREGSPRRTLETVSQAP
eukprot:6308503-Pyramimonas_sp.AAC.1